uniref:Uncharacterized protein n=1 Tax=Physcomitrium patens TaxID=3218 RepID=A0A2K1K5K1_PHYPA|nr:hypothetical protein PHYPA_010950 [Physcomitrium patens]
MELIFTSSTMILMEGEPVVQQVESGQRYRGEKPEGFSGLRLGELLIYGGLLSVSSVLRSIVVHIGKRMECMKIMLEELATSFKNMVQIGGIMFNPLHRLRTHII